MTTVVIPEGSPLTAEAPKPKPVKMVKLEKKKADKNIFAPPSETKLKRPKGKKKAAKKSPKARTARKTSGKSSRPSRSKATAKPTTTKPRGRGIRKDGKPRRRPGTNPARSKEAGAYGKRVAKARKAKGLSQKQLADKMKVSQPGIANIERGVAGASDEMKEKIKKAIGLAA